MIVSGAYSKWFAIVGWVQFFALIVVATYLSLSPAPGEIFVSVWDKFLHVLCWGTLLISLRFAWHKAGFGLLPGLALLAYSFLMEILQGFTGRDFQLSDLLANAIGILIGYLIIFLFWRFVVLFCNKFFTKY